VEKTKLYDLCSSPNIFLVIESRRMKWVRHVAHMGDRTGANRVLWGDVMERHHLEDVDLDGMIILKWIFNVWDDRA
jgi:hypothetical protein